MSDIINEFLADLKALELTLPGLPMVDVRIVWGTGQVRAGYGLKQEGLRFDVVIRYLVKRASISFLNRMSERSIARLWYIEDGSPVAMDKVPLRRPPLLGSLRPPYAPPPTSSSDKLLNAPSSSQPLAKPSRGAPSYHTPSAQPSLTSCVPPPDDRLQALPSAQRLLPVVTEFQARQAPLFQSPRVPAPSISHQERYEPPPQPIVHQPQFSSEKGIGRDPRNCVGGGETIQVASPSTALGPHPSLSEAWAPPIISRNPLAASDSARSHRPPIVPPVPLTSDACSRLKDHADEAALATFPVVRVLVLRSIGSPNGGSVTKSYEAFVTDGREYMWLALAASAAGSFGDRDDSRSVQVGSAVRLNTMSRLSGGAVCPILVHEVDVVDNSDALSVVAINGRPPDAAIRPEVPCSSETRLTIAPLPEGFDGRPTGCDTLAHTERAALLPDAKFQEERRRRILLERALADVCVDLHRLDDLYPAAAEVLMRIDELADAAAAISD